MSAAPNLPSDVRHELEHLSAHWWWLTLLGALLVVGGTLAIAFPPATVGTSLAVSVVLGVILMVEGVAMVVGSFWAGKWSGFLLQLIAGLLYIACAFLFTSNPEVGPVTLTLFIALSFIVLGIFRLVAALVLKFPQWGWSMLNGAITLVAGVVIYRNLPNDALWVVGLLVGLELLFNGWTWIMLSLVLRRLHLRMTA